MKGFIHLIEVAVAAVLITVVMSTFFSVQNVRGNWDHSDLLATGNSIGFSIDSASNMSVMLDNSQRNLEISKVKPANLDYGIYVEGASKENINVGCPQSQDICDEVKDYLGMRISERSSLLNGRWIFFNVTQMTMGDDLDDYDALVLANFTDYAAYENELIEFMEDGKVVVAINDTLGDSPAFYRLFGLTYVSPGTPSNLKFTNYAPANDKTEKYFLGMGFDIDLYGSDKIGYWKIMGDTLYVNFTGGYVYVETATPNELSEGDVFNIGGSTYDFKLKKISDDEKIVVIQPMETGFDFNNFYENSAVINGAYKIISDTSGHPAMTSNGNAIWISGFPDGDEYKTLVKAAIASNVNRWYAEYYLFGEERASASYYTSLCCDMPEPAEFNFILWYAY